MIRKVAIALFLFTLTVSALFAEDAPQGPAMVVQGTLEKLSSMLAHNLDSGATLGTPITVGETTIIPIVCKGLGFGFGTGMVQQQEEGADDQGENESNKDRKGLGCGGGGFAKPVAIMVLKKDGSFQLHRLQESGLAQVVKILFPAIQNLISKKFEFMKLRMQEDMETQPEPPQKPAGK